MAATAIKKILRWYVGTGAPANGDRLSVSVTTYPLYSGYINKTTGDIYIRTAVVGVAADWTTTDLS